MDNVLYRDDETCGWRSTGGRKLKRPGLDVLSSRCQVRGQNSVCGGALCLLSATPSSRCFLLAGSEASQISTFLHYNHFFSLKSAIPPAFAISVKDITTHQARARPRDIPDTQQDSPLPSGPLSFPSQTSLPGQVLLIFQALV